MQRRTVKKVKLGALTFGGDTIFVQSMMNVIATDIDGNVKQAVELEKAGCQINRVAIPNREALALIPAIKNATTIPLVADIHFDYRLALEAVSCGIDKIRINPGNIGNESRVHEVVKACTAANVPIRIGVNSGSIEKEILARYGAPTPQAMVDSAMFHVRLLEKYDFDQIVISLKSSDVQTMVEAYTLLAQQCDYPLHLGVTEAGTARMGIVKSAVGIGSLLLQGIGDTIRVSLTENPVQEVHAAFDILKSIGLCSKGVELVSCPTCGRTRIDLISLAKEIELRLADCPKKIKVAVMGCAVNGPGEAREADIGIAGGDHCAVLFKKGVIIRKISEDRIVEELLAEIEHSHID